MHIKVSKVTSSKSFKEYDYFDLPFCKKPKRAKPRTENIGDRLSGDFSTVSHYVVSQ